MKMNFWQTVQLMEDDSDWRDKWSDIRKRQASSNASREFQADQLGYDSGDRGDNYIGPVTPKKPVRTISGSADREEEMLHRTLPGRFGDGNLSKRMRDVGASIPDSDEAALKDREMATAHFYRQRGSFEPGAAIPTGSLRDRDKDVTATGKADVSDRPNATTPATGRFDRVQDELTQMEIQGLIRKLSNMKKNLSPADYRHHQKQALKTLTRERRSHRDTISVKTLKTLDDFIDLMKKQIHR